MGSLFDGIGGFPFAAVHNGIEPVWASEIEKFPVQVTKTHFPQMVHVGDITKLHGDKLPSVDVICGGSPCQDLSIAGKRKGLAGDRSGLFMEQVRIVKEMRGADENRGLSGLDVRPRYLVWENVPGAFSSAGGEDFRAVIEEIVRIKECFCHVPQPDTGSWGSAGAVILGDQFSLAWRVLDAQYWGVPQRRRRIFLVADFGGLTAPKILFEQESLSGDLKTGRGTEEVSAGTIRGSPENSGGTAIGTVSEEKKSCGNRLLFENHGIDARYTGPHNVAPTMSARYGTGGNNVPLISEAEISYCIAGNIIDRKVCNGGNGIGFKKDVAYTLTGMDRHAVFRRQRTDLFIHDQTASTESARQGKDATDLIYDEMAESREENACLIRRLTPLECERLQGFPDHWTAIPGASDAARYKALGNSVAIPCVDFVMRGIAYFLSREEHEGRQRR